MLAASVIAADHRLAAAVRLISRFVRVHPEERLTPDALRRGERLLLAESALARAMGTSTSGLYLTGLALALGANELQVGKLSGAVFVGGVLQFLVVPSLRWIGSRRWFCVLCLGTTRVLRFAIAATPLLGVWGVSPPDLIWTIYILLLLSAVTGTAAETVRQSWMTDLVPGAQLGRFLGWRSAIAGSAGIVAAVSYSRFIELWRGSGHAALTGFQLLIAFGTCLGVLGLWCLTKAPEPPLRETRDGPLRWSRFAVPFKDPRFRAFMAFHCAWAFAAGIAGMFFHLYMLDYLQLRHRSMGYVWIAATDILSEVLSMSMAPVWGHLADRWGTRRMLLTAATIMAVYPLLWIPITPGLWPLVFLVTATQFANSGMEIGPMTLAMQLAPPEHRSTYLSVYRSLACVMNAIAPVVGGAIALRVGSQMPGLGTFALTGLHLVFVLSAMGRLGSLFLLRRIR